MSTPANRPTRRPGEHDYEDVTRGDNTREGAEDGARQTAESLSAGHKLDSAVDAEPSYEQVTRGDNTREEAEHAVLGHRPDAAIRSEPSYEQVTRGDNTREEAEHAAESLPVV